MKLKIQIPASSSNLGPGFDCFGLALNIFNEYEIEFTDSKASFSINSNLNDEFCPNNKDNIFYKSFTGLLEKNKINEIPGVKVTLNSQIPTAGGFGSSGTAVLAGILAANKFLEKKLNEAELILEAARFEGHPDNVCASMLGAFCLSTMNETELVCKKLNWLFEDIDVLMLYPKDFRVNTDEARKVLNKEVKLEDCIENLSYSSLFTAAVASKDKELIKKCFKDNIHEEARLKLIPGAKEIIEIAHKHHALGATISGSGASIIVFVDKSTHHISIKDEAREIWTKNKLESESLMCKVSNSGALIY